MGNKLTPRQTQVIQLAAKGKSNLEIAQELNIAEQTVKHHASAAYARLDVENRTQAVVKAIRKGIITLVILLIIAHVVLSVVIGL